MSCGQIQKDPVSYNATCEGVSEDKLSDVSIEVYFGESKQDIYLILAFISQYSANPSDELASYILGYVASLPYDNAEPVEADLWVIENLPKLTDLSTYEPMDRFGGVRYHLPCKGKNIRCLAIGYSRDEYDCNLAASQIDTPKPSLIPESSPEVTNTVMETGIPATITPIAPTLSPTVEQVLMIEPLEFAGKGNAVFETEKWEGPALIHITYTPIRQYELFSVKGDGFYVGSFEPYDGVRLLDFFPGLHTDRIEVSAESEWLVEIYPISIEYIADRLISSPQIYLGNGDDVLFIEQGENYRAIIKGNSIGTNFIIDGYWDDFGPYTGWDLLVNTIDPYEGTVDIPEQTNALQIQAVGQWTIEFTSR